MPGTSENTAEKWHKQREKQREIGKAREERIHGEVINDEDQED